MTGVTLDAVVAFYTGSWVGGLAAFVLYLINPMPGHPRLTLMGAMLYVAASALRLLHIWYQIIQGSLTAEKMTDIALLVVTVIAWTGVILMVLGMQHSTARRIAPFAVPPDQPAPARAGLRVANFAIAGLNLARRIVCPCNHCWTGVLALMLSASLTTYLLR